MNKNSNLRRAASVFLACCACASDPGSVGGTGGAAGAGGAVDGGAVDGGAVDGGAVDGGSDQGAPLTLLGEHVLTWYTFQDNTPSNSAMSASGRPLVPYISVALPFRLLTPFGGSIAYGTRIYLDFLAGRTMPNGGTHTGWVQVDDFCGDNQDDSYCYQTVGGRSYPNVDLWIGDFLVSGMSPTTCSGPAGSGQELTKLYAGTPATWVASYGGSTLGKGECGNSAAAQQEQSGCWYYTPPPESASYCTGCTATTCAP